MLLFCCFDEEWLKIWKAEIFGKRNIPLAQEKEPVVWNMVNLYPNQDIIFYDNSKRRWEASKTFLFHQNIINFD